MDEVLDHSIVIFNVIQNPDGRVAGTRANGNGFDLNPWFSAVPAGATVDGRLLGDTTSMFTAGLWRLPRDPSAESAPIIVHAPSAAPGRSARITAFAKNPLYRADPEREWPMVAAAAYWSRSVMRIA